MKIETVQKFEYRIKLLERMKSDYSFFRETSIGFEQIEYFDRCVQLLDTMIAFYTRKVRK